MQHSRRLIFVLVGMIALVVTSCGSSNYLDSTRSAVQHMADTIKAYNGARAGSVSDTGTVCKSALDSLNSDGALADQIPSGKYKQVGAALQHGYISARAGFSDCVTGAQHSDYLLMAQADGEIADANRWITEARRLDR